MTKKTVVSDVIIMSPKALKVVVPIWDCLCEICD
jgi:hypothetical protein